MSKRNNFLVFLMLFVSSIFAQTASPVYQWSGGLSFTFGVKVNRIGIWLDADGVKNWFQLSPRIRVFYNLNSYGSDHSGFEFQGNLGMLFAYGKTDSIRNPFFESYANHTQKKNSVSIIYNVYLDRIGTSQGTGTLVLNFNHFYIIHENDMWGEPHSDKFRTAGILLGYRYQNNMAALRVILWTGDAFGDSVDVTRNTDYPARFGYKDLSKAPFGKFSHGILALQVSRSLEYSQTVSLNIGIDSEHVRNVVQNKAIHDMPFLPERFIGYKLANYPMLDTAGMPYLYKPSQKVKSSKFVISLSANQPVFY